MESLDALRMNQFRCSTDNSLRTLPSSSYGLIEHIKRAHLQGGYKWRILAEDVDLLTQRIGVGNSLIINTFQTGITLVIQLT